MALHAFHIWVLAVAGTGLCAWWLAVRPGASSRAIASPVCVLILVMTAMLSMLALQGQDGPAPGPRQALTAQTVVMGPVVKAHGPAAEGLRPADETSRTLP